MDIELLSKMVKETILDNDSVTLPGVGSFVAEMMPAVFSDKGYTINPPYRRLSFFPREGDDSLLADVYASSNGISRDDALRILVDFLQEMTEVLKIRKTIVFPGLGRLRATRENNFFFVADEDLDIYPAGLGFEPISLKTHVETPEEVRSVVASLAEAIAPSGSASGGQEMASASADPRLHHSAAPSEPEPAPEPEPVLEPESVPCVPEDGTQDTNLAENVPYVPENGTQDTPEPAAEPEAPAEPEPAIEPELAPAPVAVAEPTPVPEPAPASEPAPAPAKPKRRARAFWRTFGILLLIVVAVAAAWAIIGRVDPDWVDSFLYSEEELEILRY